MKGISNYNKGESLATGFARPKVTSLFFDKIWLPNSILDSTYEYTGIPKELLVEEDNGSYYFYIRVNTWQYFPL